jgi:GR25 family glycosyltransferase involved in LPS biosynthesis
LKSKAPYIAIFEDDVTFSDGWMSRVLKAVMDVKYTP